MTVEAKHADHLAVVVGACGPVIAVKGHCRWNVRDGETVLVSLVAPNDANEGLGLVAQRCAELIERFGLVDAPENAAGIT